MKIRKEAQAHGSVSLKDNFLEKKNILIHLDLKAKCFHKNQEAGNFIDTLPFI